MTNEIRSVYLDCHSTTPVDPAVLARIVECYETDFGNPGSSQHFWGQDAADLVQEAREKVTSALGFQEDEVVFTSGATEANNLAILGLIGGSCCRGIASRTSERNEVLTLEIEHPSVLEPVSFLENVGCKTRICQVNSHQDPNAGLVDLEQFSKNLDPKTALVCIGLANNEIGAIQPIKEIAELVHSCGALLHVDAAQAVPWLDCQQLATVADSVAISGHKIYGPKGVGALCFNRQKLNRVLKPMQIGGGQEFGFRSGTLNTPGIVGLGAAIELVSGQRVADHSKVKKLRDLLWQLLQEGIAGIELNGPGDFHHRLPNNLNVRLPGLTGDTLIAACPTVALSSGSACATAHQGPSHVLKAIGLSDELADCSLRIGLGRFHTEDQIRWAASQIIATFCRLTGQ